jgi:hypothetical protein
MSYANLIELSLIVLYGTNSFFKIPLPFQPVNVK